MIKEGCSRATLICVYAMWPCPLISAPVSAPRPTPHCVLAVFPGNRGWKREPLPQSNNFPPWHRTNITSVSLRHSLWKCQTSSFHLEILSDLLSSSPSDEGPICTGLCFIWISKPVRRWSNILNSIFGAFFKECVDLRVLDEGIWSMGQCSLCAGRVMVSFIWFLKTRWAQQRICIWVRSSFSLLSSDGIWEIVHIFGLRSTQRWTCPWRHLRPAHVYWAAFIQLMRGTQESLSPSGTYWHNVWEFVTRTICVLCVRVMFMSQQ